MTHHIHGQDNLSDSLDCSAKRSQDGFLANAQGRERVPPSSCLSANEQCGPVTGVTPPSTSPLTSSNPELLVSPNQYRVRLTGVAEAVVHRRNGSTGADLRFEIIEGPYSGRIVYTPIWFPHDGLPSYLRREYLTKLRHACKALGLRGPSLEPVPERTTFRDCVGAELHATIRISEWESKRKSGTREYRNVIASFLDVATNSFKPPSDVDRPFAEVPCPDTIRRWAADALAGGPVVVRALGLHGAWGRFPQSVEAVYSGPSKIDRLVQDVVDLSNLGASGCYYVLNRVNSKYLGDGPDQFPLDVIRGGGRQVADRHIERRTHLLIDGDPLRRNGVQTGPATADEMADALELCNQVQHLLTKHGFPEPMMVATGNGGGLTYPVDLPADDPRPGRLLGLLGAEFEGSQLGRVDTSCSNPARISKIPGTVSRKGTPSEERPHRIARILGNPVPGDLVTEHAIDAAIAYLEHKHLAVSACGRSRNTPGQQSTPRAGGQPLTREGKNVVSQAAGPAVADAVLEAMLDRALQVLQDHGSPASRGGPTSDGRFLVCLDHCPLENEHSTPSKPGDAAVMLDLLGRWSAKCFHQGHGPMTFDRVRSLLGIRGNEWPFDAGNSQFATAERRLGEGRGADNREAQLECITVRANGRAAESHAHLSDCGCSGPPSGSGPEDPGQPGPGQPEDRRRRRKPTPLVQNQRAREGFQRLSDAQRKYCIFVDETVLVNLLKEEMANDRQGHMATLLRDLIQSHTPVMPQFLEGLRRLRISSEARDCQEQVTRWWRVRDQNFNFGDHETARHSRANVMLFIDRNKVANAVLPHHFCQSAWCKRCGVPYRARIANHAAVRLDQWEQERGSLYVSELDPSESRLPDSARQATEGFFVRTCNRLVVSTCDLSGFKGMRTSERVSHETALRRFVEAICCVPIGCVGSGRHHLVVGGKHWNQDSVTEEERQNSNVIMVSLNGGSLALYLEAVRTSQGPTPLEVELESEICESETRGPHRRFRVRNSFVRTMDELSAWGERIKARYEEFLAAHRAEEQRKFEQCQKEVEEIAVGILERCRNRTDATRQSQHGRMAC